ncbi:calcium-dependent protein kinase 10-like protein [Tanacetum coccineum]|uniref:Calcium-dependent protein kinase 10-like protein n=1 Tax=Tanacetum coccineum TaxID=301880 RepID=A0ABQ5D513_9ASTR
MILVLKFYPLPIYNADVDNSLVLEYGEFVAVTIHLQRMENDEHLRRAFMFFDKDGIGYIDLDELEQVLYEYGQGDINVLNQIMKEVNTDKELISGLATGQNTRSEPFLNLKAAVDYKDVALGGGT